VVRVNTPTPPLSEKEEKTREETLYTERSLPHSLRGGFHKREGVKVDGTTRHRGKRKSYLRDG
jgi:hypothetical protein